MSARLPDDEVGGVAFAEDRDRLRAVLDFPDPEVDVDRAPGRPEATDAVAADPVAVTVAEPAVDPSAEQLRSMQETLVELVRSVAALSERLTMLELGRSDPIEQFSEIDGKLDKLLQSLPDIAEVASSRKEHRQALERMEHLKATLDRWGLQR